MTAKRTNEDLRIEVLKQFKAGVPNYVIADKLGIPISKVRSIIIDTAKLVPA